MALEDFVQVIYSAPLLNQLTNPDVSPTPGTINMANLTAATASVRARFGDRVGMPFSDTNQSHLDLGAPATLLFLRIRRGLPFQEERTELAALDQELFRAAKAMAGAGTNWVPPATDSGLTPSTDSPNGRTVRPIFDDRRFGDLLPDARGGGNGFSDDRWD